MSLRLKSIGYRDNLLSQGNLRMVQYITHPANIPTRYWLTPSGVRLPTSENTKDMRSGLERADQMVDGMGRFESTYRV